MIPLAGNGWHAPQSAIYSDATSTGDATGSYNLIEYIMDPAHSHMIGYAAISADLASADVRAIVNIQWSQVAEMQTTVLLNYTTEGFGQVNGLYRPFPLMIPSAPAGNSSALFRVWVPNVDGQVVTVRMLAYQFHPGARDTTPLPFLVSNFAS